MALDSIGKFLYISDVCGDLKWINIQEKRIKNMFGYTGLDLLIPKGLRSGICSMVLSSNARYLFTGDFEGGLLKWDLKLKRIKKKLVKAHDGSIFAMAVTKNIGNELLVTGDCHGYIKIWNLKKGTLLKELNKNNGEMIAALCIFG